MATFTLNADTVETTFDQNDDENGFQLITTAIPGQRLYRISRERATQRSGTAFSLTTTLDYFDFYLDLSDVAPGTLIIKDVPYIPSLFSVSPTPKQLSEISPNSQGIHFDGEKFKLLFLTPTVSGDPIREIPSYINLKATYTMSGVPRPIRFIYYTLVDGRPVYTGYLGNVAFSDQYDQNNSVGHPSITIDSTKRINIITVDGSSAGDPSIDYYVIRVSTTPGMIVTKGIAKASEISETYNDEGIKYMLRASSGGTATWASSDGLRQNGFFVFATITQLNGFPLDNPDVRRFYLFPQEAIDSFTTTQLSTTEFQFVIKPKVGITNMDLRIKYTSLS